MPIYIQNIATAVPEFSLAQPFIREKMKQHVGDDDLSRRIIHRIYSHSGIEKRYTVINDFQANNRQKLFFKDDGSLATPSTKVRNDIYAKHAKSLYVQVADKLLKRSPEVKKEHITHVITVSCTGFFAPGPAFHIVRELGLSASVQRFHLGFMGCFAAFPALKMAHSICGADPDAVVMVVSVELCTLHLQNSTETDQLISASIFADGAAGAIISTQEPAKKPAFRIESFQTSVAEDSEEDMAWAIGDTGFEMALSMAIPNIIGENVEASIAPLLKAYGLPVEEVNHFTVHPGGRAILDRVERQLRLRAEQIAPSRRVLSQYGNMSSATILFVLQELLHSPPTEAEERTVAMAFGPGLTIESAYLLKIS